MRNVWLIAQRELQAYLRTKSGYIIIALMLFIDGLCFNAFAVPGPGKKSAEILGHFFYFTSGITMVGSIFLAMRLLAEERSAGTLALLYSSPVHDLEIVLGKFTASLIFLCLFFLTTAYMPILVGVYGKVSAGQVFAGYFGLVLLGAMCLAIGTFGSSLTKSQVIAAVFSGVICLAVTMAQYLAKITDRPLTDVVQAMFWFGHFEPFSAGAINLKHVTYFALATFFSLFAATRVLEARRWR
jgi:ABC-2 type transport system permease protein